MFAPSALAIAVAVAPLQPAAAADRPISRHIEQTVFTATSRTTAVARQDDKDSLKNGAIIGAVALAAVAAVGLGTICHALHEPGDPPCWKGVLPWTVAGAGIGALAGAGVDAMFQRRFAVGASIRF
jgi:hypothetical protein